MNTPSTLASAKAIESEIIQLRRDFHKNPEISWQEVQTSQKVADYCSKLGLHVQRPTERTGVVVSLHSENKGPVLALRADMDALPIQEETDHEFKSTKAGAAHLCGHDAHTAMLMGAAKILSGLKDKIPFQVRFLFQPAEEIVDGGAQKMIADGDLKDVDEIFGLHVYPFLPKGTLGTRAGPMMASMDKLELRVEGVGGHAAFPHKCLDPVLASAEIILALQSIISRRVDPIDPAVLSITQIHAGSAFNVIPQEVLMHGTVRSLSRETWMKIPKWIEEISNGIAKAHGQKAILNYTRGTTVLINDGKSTEKLGRTFEKLGGKVVDFSPMMGGEDFSYYLEKVPGSFAFIGVSDGTPRTQYGLHHPKFDLDESALHYGTATFVELVLSKAGIHL